tara:strand:+ start:1440 stop:1877 length:438 start_codon:yes stop_codon:yes gene_type:complete
MPVKSFRGQLTHGIVGMETISLHTNDGSTGYRIKKLELLGSDLTGRDQESVFKVYTVKQTAVDGVVDFSDQTLLAAGFYEQVASTSYFGDQIVVFDNITFNQDIFLTNDEAKGGHPINYHIELEMVKLDLNENTVATLKDLRNTD